MSGRAAAACSEPHGGPRARSIPSPLPLPRRRSLFCCCFCFRFLKRPGDAPIGSRPWQRPSPWLPAPRRQWPRPRLPARAGAAGWPGPGVRGPGCRSALPHSPSSAFGCATNNRSGRGPRGLPFIPPAFLGHNKLFKPLNRSRFLPSGVGMGAVGARLGLDGVPRVLGSPDVSEVGLEYSARGGNCGGGGGWLIPERASRDGSPVSWRWKDAGDRLVGLPLRVGGRGQPWLFGVCWSGPLSTYKVTGLGLCRVSLNSLRFCVDAMRILEMWRPWALAHSTARGVA